MQSKILIVIFMLFSTSAFAGKTIVFVEKYFPAVDNNSIDRQSLEQALSHLSPQFIGLAELQQQHSLDDCSLLVLPYGSAFPADAWETLQAYFQHGNILVLGGRPFFVPVHKVGNQWHIEEPQNTYSRTIGIFHTYAVPHHPSWQFQWSADEAPSFQQPVTLNPQEVFVEAGFNWRYRGLGFLSDSAGNRLAAPVTAQDFIDYTLPPRRHVYVCINAGKEFWKSRDAGLLIRQSAVYAALGGIRLWVNLDNLALTPGSQVSGTIDILRNGAPAKVDLQLLSGTAVLSAQTWDCGNSLHQGFHLNVPLTEPGLYKIQATLRIGDTVIEHYTTGAIVSDSALLHSGASLSAGRDYFRLGQSQTPYLMVGTNYFSTDAYTGGIFYGSSLGGNAWNWEQDFTEMERQGLTAVRTGIWLNRARYLDVTTGAPEERLLHSIEAFLTAAARHHMQVIFTFFAFNPQDEMEAGNGQNDALLGPGSNPYIDPIAIESQTTYLKGIVSRFRDVPFLSFDLINEPSYSNPKRIWKGNSPNNDPVELAAWHRWLEQRYTTVENLAAIWRTPPSTLGSFDNISLPSFSDLEVVRSGNLKMPQAIDYNLFAQDAFRHWIDSMISAIRSTGAKQAITVGQDEGGVADRVLNQFWASTDVAYTVNHTWWRDDALLWSSVAAKTLTKPNLIGETGLQPVWSMDGSWRFDELKGLPMFERKMVLGFAAANTGVLQWDWTHSDTYGIFRRDGSQKQWMNVLHGIAAFARDAQPYAIQSQRPEIALVLPQSMQQSVFGWTGQAAQQNAVRALFHIAHQPAFVVGEYQLSQMPEAKLIIVPSPWVFNQQAWNILMQRVQAGATLLISGRIDADEHWISVPERLRNWHLDYTYAPMNAREGELVTPAGTFHLTYSGDKTTYGEYGILNNGKTFLEMPYGKGTILYSTLPLELADQIYDIGKIYAYAAQRAGVTPVYTTTCDDPGILICPTRLPEATLYVLTSESSVNRQVQFTDTLSGKEFRLSLPSGRAALLLVGTKGNILASYNYQ